MGFNLDWGIVAIIVACLVFYARLMMAQRRKTKQWEEKAPERVAGRKKGSRKKHGPATEKPVFGGFSRRKRDWLVGGVGYLLVMLGVLLYVGYIKHDVWSTLWWFPVAVGIIGFSWFFN